MERIEVLRGSQSAIYGSGAIGGVINIILKRGTKKPIKYLNVIFIIRLIQISINKYSENIII